jgi:hypothetical protein
MYCPRKSWRKPSIVNNATAAHITAANQAHQEATHVYRTYKNVNQKFKTLIIDAFEDRIIDALSNELDILTHLITYCWRIAPTELIWNYERFNTPYDPNQLIKTLFQQSQDARGFALAGGHPNGDAMIVNISFSIVFDTGLLPDDWHAASQIRPAALNTWTNFKVDFLQAHREIRLTNHTAQQSGFHSANMMIKNDSFQGTLEAIVQLAVATASDCDAVATLTATNAKLTM